MPLFSDASVSALAGDWPIAYIDCVPKNASLAESRSALRHGSPHLPGRHPNKRGIPDAGVFTASPTSMTGTDSRRVESFGCVCVSFSQFVQRRGHRSGHSRMLTAGRCLRDKRTRWKYRAVVFRCHVMSIIMLVCLSIVGTCPGAYFSASPLFLA